MNTLKYVYVWSINHRLGYCFNQKRCWTTTSQFMCICRTSAELEDPNSIATRKAFSTRNETSIFNKSHLVRLLLSVGNSKHVLVGPLGRDVPLRPRTTNHILSLYSFRVLDKLTFYKKKLNTIKNLAPKSTIKVISCSNENEIFLKFQIFKKKDVPLFKGMNESVYLYVTMVCSGLMKTMIYQYINIYFKSLTNVKFVVHFLWP